MKTYKVFSKSNFKEFLFNKFSIIAFILYFCIINKNMEKLKNRWGLTSNWQVVIILLVFSITGYSSLLIAKPIMDWIGLTEEATNPWIYKPLRLILIFPFYQVLIVMYGWIFGQFDFFWNFEKKMLKRIGFKRFFKEVDN